MDLRPLLRPWPAEAAPGPASPGSCAPSGSYGSRAPRRLRTPTLLVPWLAVHSDASLIPMHSRSCAPFRLLGLAGVLAAPVPMTRNCATLQIPARSGLRHCHIPHRLSSAQPPTFMLHLSLRRSVARASGGARPPRRRVWLPFLRGSDLCPTSSSLTRAPMARDCSDSGQGKIPAFYAGSDDTRGCLPLLGGAVTVVICAPLRASGETLGPVIWIVRRRRLGVVLLREGAVLVARGVLDSGSGDVGRCVVDLGYFLGWRV